MEILRIHELIDHWATDRPIAIAIQDQFNTLSYEALKTAYEGVSANLKSLGVRPGDRVLIVSENSSAVCVLALALSKLDAWFCVINARLSEREIDQAIAHSGARLVVYTDHVSSDAQKHGARHSANKFEFHTLGELLVGPVNKEASPETVFISPNEQVAALIYTSGTSGAPKGVLLTHGSLIFVAQTSKEMRKTQFGDVIYGVMPMAHVVGLSNQFLGTMAAGATLILDPKFTVETTLNAIEKYGATSFTGVPAMYAKIVDWCRVNNRKINAPALRYLSTAGAPLTPSLKKSVEDLFGLILNNGFGLTEMAPTLSQTRIDAPRTDCSVGQPIPGVQVRIVDANLKDVKAGEVGELWVKGPNLMKGYYKEPELTKKVINQDGWFNTGDMARLTDDGSLFIEGRTKELIIRSGFNVYPLEVEQVLNSYPAVVQSAVVGKVVQDNEEVIAFIEIGSGVNYSEDELRQYLRKCLSPYKVPSEIKVVQALPSAPSGKILKHILKSQVNSN